MSKKDKGPPFVMVTNQALDAPAWRAMSHGARSLYIALKRRYWPNKKNNGRIYLSHRQARKELGRSSPNEIVRWFRELQYYGFIVMITPGCLGVNGNGKAPRWRLTEVSYMRGTSSRGMEDMPTMEFMKWNGVRFSKHQDGGDHLKNLESRYGKPERTVTENRNTSVTENRNTSWNNRYGKPEHIDGATVTENRSRSYKPCGAGRALSERTGSNRKPVERMKPDRSGTSSMSDRGRDSGRLWLVLRTARSTTPLLGSGHHGLRLVLGSRWTPSAAFGLAPLEERKRELAKLLRKAGWALHFNEHTDEPGDIVFRHACKMGLEGIVVADSGPILKTGETPTPIAPALYPGCRGFAPDPVWKKGKNPKSNFWDFSVFQLSRLPRNARDSAALANEIGSSKHQQTSRQSYSEILSSV